MNDKEIRELEERRIPAELTTRTIRKVNRLAKVVGVLPRPKRRPFGDRCPRCGRKLRKSVTEVQSSTFACYRFRYTYWRCGPRPVKWCMRASSPPAVNQCMPTGSATSCSRVSTLVVSDTWGR